ncbi:MAG TPA: hypothetical protein VHN14_16510 [Kofleriaceae bacterium]|jgi:hypothetical protein|nr:hypothetical protein [Kofleriaceae bacterium]
MRTTGFLVGCVLLATFATSAAAAPAAHPPSAPALGQAWYTVVAFAGRPAPIKLAWPALAGVHRFRARWTDAGAQVELDLPGTATAFERSDAAPGHHDLSIIAIDGRGSESEPTEVAVDVVAITAIPPGGTPASPTAGPAFAIGSTFTSPGLACQLGSAPAGPQAVAIAIGATLLACGGGPGQPRVEIPVVIAPVMIAGPTAPIARETPTRVHITLGSVAPIGATLQVEAIGDLDLGEAERSATGIDVSVTARAGAIHTGLVIRAGDIELGRLELALVDRAPPPATEPRIDWFALDAGGQIGALVLPSDGRGANALGNPSDANDTLTTGPLLGARVGLFPIHRVGIESELSLAVPGYRGHPGQSMVISTRAQLAVRLIDDHRYGLRIIGGAGALGILANRATSQRTVNGAVHGGAAFTIETRPDLWLRIEVLHVLTSAQDAGFAHGMEIQLGVVTRLGRRDRSR